MHFDQIIATRSKQIVSGHAIALPHDSPSVVIDMFYAETMKGLINLHFVCEDEKSDPLMYKAFRLPNSCVSLCSDRILTFEG
jgi:hypothetical protein